METHKNENIEPDFMPLSSPTFPDAPRMKSASLPEAEDLSPIQCPLSIGPDESSGQYHDLYDASLYAGFVDGSSSTAQLYGEQLDLYGVTVPLGQFVESNATASLYEENRKLYNDSIPKVPLIDGTTSIFVLRAEYENGSTSFVKQIDWLASNGFNDIRRSRGDGNCFYRSIGFAYVERVLRAPEEAGREIAKLNATIDMVKAAGFEATYEQFFVSLTTLLYKIAEPDTYGELTSQGLLEAFQDSEVSDSIVFFLRLLTSAQMRTNSESYEPFLIHPDSGAPISLPKFCQESVEIMGTEADHVQATALCHALKISVDVAYLDGKRSDGEVDFISFVSEGMTEESEPLQLLYRPGHYDMLIKSGKGKQRAD